MRKLERKLEIGGERVPKPGYEQFDLHNWGLAPIYHIGDASDLSRFTDGTFDELFSSNVLEHFGRLETSDVLREWIRVVRIDGRLVLELPDIAGMIDDWQSGLNDFEHFIERVFGTQDYDGNTHYTLFTMTKFHEFVRNTFPELETVELYQTAKGGGFHITAIRHAL